MTHFYLLALIAAMLTSGCNSPATQEANGDALAAEPAALTAGHSTILSKAVAPTPSPTVLASGADHAVINASLKRELVGTAQVDGEAITDVQMVDRCRTRFNTADAAIYINWARIGNFAAREANGVVSLPITDDHGTHIFTVREDAVSRRIDGSMGLLADDCGG
jgi:PBP1b-binding outer membrane lipoprotein LpoB